MKNIIAGQSLPDYSAISGTGIDGPDLGRPMRDWLTKGKKCGAILTSRKAFQHYLSFQYHIASIKNV